MLTQTAGFKNLDKALQLFVTRLADGETKTRSFITRNHKATQQTVKKDMLALSSHIQQQVITELDQRRESQVRGTDNARLLQSLKYPSMNERRSTILPGVDTNFASIFGNRPKSKTDTDSQSGPPDKSDTYNQQPKGAHSELDEYAEKSWQAFICWLKSNDSFFWITGKPGSGKSTLVNFLADHEETRRTLELWRPNYLIASHFLWNLGGSMQCNLRGLLASLLHQLIDQDAQFATFILANFPRYKKNDSYTDWSARGLEEVLLAALIERRRPCCLFIDGLDEIHEEDGPESVVGLIQKLCDSPGVKICASSRPEPLFRAQFSEGLLLELHMLQRQQMREYIQQELLPMAIIRGSQFLPKTDKPSAGLIEIQDQLIRKAQGVFLWLVIAVKSLREGIIHGEAGPELQARVDRLPLGLEAMYKSMWGRIKKDDEHNYRISAAKYFKFALSSSPFLTTSTQLSWALATDEALLYRAALPSEYRNSASNLLHDIASACQKIEKEITVRCAGLLTVTRAPIDELLNTDAITSAFLTTVGFVHRTVHEFLTRSELGRQILDSDKSCPTCIAVKLSIASSFSGWCSNRPRGASGSVAEKMAREKISNLFRSIQDAVDRVRFGGNSVLRVALNYSAEECECLARLRSKVLVSFSKNVDVEPNCYCDIQVEAPPNSLSIYALASGAECFWPEVTSTLRSLPRNNQANFASWALVWCFLNSWRKESGRNPLARLARLPKLAGFVKMLLHYGADPNTKLLAPSLVPQTATSAILREWRGFIDDSYSVGDTLGYLPIVEMLSRAGADFNSRLVLWSRHFDTNNTRTLTDELSSTLPWKGGWMAGQAWLLFEVNLSYVLSNIDRRTVPDDKNEQLTAELRCFTASLPTPFVKPLLLCLTPKSSDNNELKIYQIMNHSIFTEDIFATWVDSLATWVDSLRHLPGNIVPTDNDALMQEFCHLAVLNPETCFDLAGSVPRKKDEDCEVYGNRVYQYLLTSGQLHE